MEVICNSVPVELSPLEAFQFFLVNFCLTMFQPHFQEQHGKEAEKKAVHSPQTAR